MFNKNRGFTLIELLIVIAIIAILASVAFVSLDPLTRFQDARDASRWADVSALLSAVKVHQVDNAGAYLTSITSLPADTPNMVSGNATAPIADCNTSCSVVGTASACVSLSGLVTAGYLGTMPVSPDGAGTWSSDLTGYYITRNANNSITVGACDAEGGADITVNR